MATCTSPLTASGMAGGFAGFVGAASGGGIVDPQETSATMAAINNVKSTNLFIVHLLGTGITACRRTAPAAAPPAPHR